LEWTAEFPVYYAEGFADGLDNFTVEFTHGFAAAPAVVKHVACDMVSIAIASTVSAVPGVKRESKTTGNISVSFDYGQAVGQLRLGSDHKEILSRFTL
jgi:hypothetical protein